MNKMRLLSEIKDKGYFLSHSNVLIAVSTGIDSMNLLYFLYEVKDILRISIAIAHVNHHQRLESDMEEDFLRKWADDHAIPIYVSHFQGDFTEVKAREHRYEFFKSIMRNKGYTALVTAHHADDQAETVFMRLIKGKHLKSLVAIRDRSKFANGEIIRPMLSMKKQDFDDTIPYFEDKSNFDSLYFRNRIRNDYIPMLKKENPRFADALVDYTKDIHDVYSILKELTSDIQIGNVKEFINYSTELQTYLLEKQLEDSYQIQISKNEINQIIHVISYKSNALHHVKGKVYLDKHYDFFKFIKIGPETDRKRNDEVLNYGEKVNYNQYKFHFMNIGRGFPIPTFNFSPIILRGRKDGDKIKINGMTKKVRRLFIDDKVPTDLREKAVIVEQEKTILAILIEGKYYLRNDIKDDIMKGILYMEELEK